MKPGLPSSSDSRPGRRRLRIAGVSVLVVLAIAGIGAAVWYRVTDARLPKVDLAGVDPAVAEAVRAARSGAVWRPWSAEERGHYGMVLLAHGMNPQAEVCFAQAEQLDSHDPRWPYLRALCLDADPKARIGALQRAVAASGTRGGAPLRVLAETCLECGRLDEAERQFRRLRKEEPDNPWARLGLGRIALERDQLPEALDVLKQAATDPRTARAAQVLLAEVYQRQGDRTAAARARTRAAALPEDPPPPDPYREQVTALQTGKQARLQQLKQLQQQNRLEEARRLAQSIESDYPDIYWHVEGRVRLARGDLPQAEQALRKAVELDPTSADARFDLGTVLLREKDYRAAAEVFQELTRREPEYGPAYLRLGECWKQLGEPDKALEALRAAVRIMPQQAETHRELGALLADQGKAKEALPSLRRAATLSPDDARTRELLEQVSRAAKRGSR